MKIGFFGTPSFASSCFESLAEYHDMLFAVTMEDKPKGRTLAVKQTPVKESALKRNIPVFSPKSLSETELIGQLTGFDADIFVVVAYGKIIPRVIFDMPKFGTINLHPSLLPRFRGASPVEAAILAGETTSGVTVQRITERLDAGDILIQEKFEIEKNDTSSDVFSKVTPLGIELLKETLKRIDSNNVTPIIQNEADATYCGKINRESARIDWLSDSNTIHNLVRAMNPRPVAWTRLNGIEIRIFKTLTDIPDDLPSIECGSLYVYKKKRLFAGCRSGAVEIVQIQPENRKIIDALSFINGYRPKDGDRFE